MAEDVSLLDRARAIGASPGPKCRFARLSDHPRAAEIQQLLEACGSEVQYSTAESVLREAGIDLKADTISRHVRKLCSCRS